MSCSESHLIATFMEEEGVIIQKDNHHAHPAAMQGLITKNQSVSGSLRMVPLGQASRQVHLRSADT